jgi:hypothetical protein
MLVVRQRAIDYRWRENHLYEIRSENIVVKKVPLLLPNSNAYEDIGAFNWAKQFLIDRGINLKSENLKNRLIIVE